MVFILAIINTFCSDIRRIMFFNVNKIIEQILPQLVVYYAQNTESQRFCAIEILDVEQNINKNDFKAIIWHKAC